LSYEHPTKRISWVRTWRAASKIIAEGRHGVLQSHRVEHMAVEPVQNAKVGFAKSPRGCQHGLEHRFEVTWRTGGKLQKLGGRCLLFQRLRKLARENCNSRFRIRVVRLPRASRR